MDEPEEGIVGRGGAKLCKATGGTENGCPDMIFKSAKTAWQKNVALEFIKIYEVCEKLKNDMKWIKWLLGSTVIAIAINILLRVI